MGFNNFKASNGWLEGFKNNKKISYQSMAGESHDVNENTVEQFKANLPEIIKGYELKNIANVDECGLFFRLLPDKTFHFKGDRCHGGKKSKDRITVLLTVFADGTLSKPLVIGKNKNPRCFKNIKIKDLPVEYMFNKKAWMTTAIFLEYLEKLNRQLIRENRKIILFLDNAASHPKTELSNIKLQFLPSNCTSKLQPLDGGIIQCVKMWYRKLMLQSVIASMDSSNDPSTLVKGISVLDAIMFLNKAIKNVTSSCIQKCFMNCGFRIDSEIIGETYIENSDDLQNLIDIFAENLDSSIRASDYVAIDNNISTENEDWEVSNFLPTEEAENDKDEHDESDNDTVPTTEEILSSIKILKNFAKMKGDCNLLSNIEEIRFQINNEIVKNSIKKTKQMSIDSFFKKL